MFSDDVISSKALYKSPIPATRPTNISVSSKLSPDVIALNLTLKLDFWILNPQCSKCIINKSLIPSANVFCKDVNFLVYLEYNLIIWAFSIGVPAILM